MKNFFYFSLFIGCAALTLLLGIHTYVLEQVVSSFDHFADVPTLLKVKFSAYAMLTASGLMLTLGLFVAIIK